MVGTHVDLDAGNLQKPNINTRRSVRRPAVVFLIFLPFCLAIAFQTQTRLVASYQLSSLFPSEAINDLLRQDGNLADTSHLLLDLKTRNTSSSPVATNAVALRKDNQVDSFPTRIQGLTNKTSLPMPLQPPYRIVQLGKRRSGSTFQFQLLDAIARLNTGNLYNITFQGFVPTYVKISAAHERVGESFVVKSHNERDPSLEGAQKDGKLVVFTSGFPPDHRISRFSLYNQRREGLEDCSMCEIEQYREIFGLSYDDVAKLKAHMQAFEKLRRCCGFQMSKYEMARLNGCNITQEMKQRPSYPNCDMDKSAMERDMANSPLGIRNDNPESLWSQPGDCAKFDALIRQGIRGRGRRYNKVEHCPN